MQILTDFFEMPPVKTEESHFSDSGSPTVDVPVLEPIQHVLERRVERFDDLFVPSPHEQTQQVVKDIVEAAQLDIPFLQ